MSRNVQNNSSVKYEHALNCENMEVNNMDLAGNENNKSKEFNGFRSPADNIIDELRKNGYAVMPAFLSNQECSELISHLNALDVQRFNTNELGGQYSGNGFFEQRLTAKSKLIYKILLDSNLHDIFSGFFDQNPFRVISTRLYKITGGFRYSFHTDNKNEDQKAKTSGLACVIYLNDTDDGCLEVYEGSHKDSDNVSTSTVKSDFLDARYGFGQRKRLPGSAGTLILSDIRTFHGSKQVDTREEAYRLWFQVNDDLQLGERMLIDPSLIEGPLTKKQLRFLGFGLPNIGKAYPLTSLTSAPTPVFWSNFFEMLMASPKSIKSRLHAEIVAKFRRH